MRWFFVAVAVGLLVVDGSRGHAAEPTDTVAKFVDAGGIAKRDAAGTIIDLDLRACAVTNAGMRKLPSLFVGSTAISSAGLERLAGLESLRDLSLQRTGVEAASVEQLRRRQPNVKISLGETADE